MPWDAMDEAELTRLRIERDDYALSCRGVLQDGHRDELFFDHLALLDRQIARLLERKPKEEAA